MLRARHSRLKAGADAAVPIRSNPMSATITTLVDFIRHGEPVGGRKYRGQTDDPLSDKGWAQMRTAVGDSCPWQAIVSSPLARCRAFAEELGNRHRLPVTVDTRWQELGFGAWEGRTPGELTADDPERLLRFRSDPIANAPPGGEPLTSFRSRIDAAWNDLLERHTGRHVLVVAHAGTIRMVLAHVLGMPLDRVFRIQVSNAAITRVRVDNQGDLKLPSLLFHAGRLE
jgi:alpha-ribazole phosphatase